MNAAQREPAISVVIVTDRYASIRSWMASLAAQTLADRIELVIVTPDPDSVPADSETVSRLGTVKVIPAAELRSLSPARARGIRASSAPIVALAENHAFPDPGWAEALLESHEGPWTAVGPGITNANPRRALSWADLMLDYGPWLEPDEGREMVDLPGHNSSYKRAALAQFDGRLEQLLEGEYVLHQEMRKRAMRLWMEPRARIAHLNVTLPSAWLGQRLAAGRRFAAARARGWNPVRRLAYAAGTPLIPLIRLWRLLPVWRRCTRRHDLPGALLLALLVSLAISAIGELLGYLTGSGGSIEHLAQMELHRERHVHADELPVVAPQGDRDEPLAAGLEPASKTTTR